MATILAVGSLLMIVALPLLVVTCHFLCAECQEAYRQAQRDARQLKVARELMALARKEKQAQEANGLLIVTRAKRPV